MILNIGLLEWFILIFFFLLPLILTIISLVDILKSEFEGYNKIIWLLAVILLPFIGAGFYYFVGRKQKVRL